MDEALGAQKGERSAGRQGYRSGYYVAAQSPWRVALPGWGASW